MAQKNFIKFQTQIITIRNQHTIYWDTELIFTSFYAKIKFPCCYIPRVRFSLKERLLYILNMQYVTQV